MENTENKLNCSELNAESQSAVAGGAGRTYSIQCVKCKHILGPGLDYRTALDLMERYDRFGCRNCKEKESIMIIYD